ncbi:hypothetical protein BOS5A_80043 [Bosea sp. EC-HK365B]|nr:hypothetical protein BOSE21B_111437 [Bosea sp. 21B]CAD5270401.1 hypothetical protein BOSE7B_20203 [Bosea sp. 7B]VVT62383.1 hypothetical protein BOS5A_80043 [Bosea sp. EC-HK365B]VXC65854.1 hypothetical protein BOSE127_30216 [Bosea sp. 127]
MDPGFSAVKRAALPQAARFGDVFAWFWQLTLAGHHRDVTTGGRALRRILTTSEHHLPLE